MYTEEMGFDGLMHSAYYTTPCCMQGAPMWQPRPRRPGEYVVQPWRQSPPALSSRDAAKRRLQILGVAAVLGLDSRGGTIFAPYAEQALYLSSITGTPASVLPKIRASTDNAPHHTGGGLRPGAAPG